jgi:hypothetical protein
MDTTQPTQRPARTRPDRRLLTLHELLAAVDRARWGTRLEQLCWDLNLDERWIRPGWDLAARIGLLERRGSDPLTGQVVYVLSQRGHRALRELGGRRRDPR